MNYSCFLRIMQGIYALPKYPVDVKARKCYIVVDKGGCS
jgi:hypothetical protein